jgi:hypothetical protein
MKTLNLSEAAAFLHMHPEEVRMRAKRAIIPGAKIGRRWVFIEEDLADFVRSLYPEKRRPLPVKNSVLEIVDRSSGVTSSREAMKEYEDLLNLAPKRRRRG